MELSEEYARLLNPRGVSDEVLSQTERDLGLRLPDGVRRVAGFFAGDLLGGVSHKAWDPADPDSAVSATVRLRAAIALPERFVVLAEQPESFIVLDTHSGRVVWAHDYDAMNLATGHELSVDTDLFSDYESFIEFLIDQEADEQEAFPS